MTGIIMLWLLCFETQLFCVTETITNVKTIHVLSRFKITDLILTVLSQRQIITSSCNHGNMLRIRRIRTIIRKNKYKHNIKYKKQVSAANENDKMIINQLSHWEATAKLFNLNFHPLEVVSRWRDPQLQVSENYGHIRHFDCQGTL